MGRYIQILHISQEIHGGHRSAMQTLLDCDVERTALLREKAILEGDEPEPGPDDGVDADGVDGGSGTEKSGGGGATDSANLLDAMGLEGGDNSTERLVDIYDRLDEIDADTAPTRAAIILSGLSFTPEMMDQPTSSLSGGWRMRVSLARVCLFCSAGMMMWMYVHSVFCVCDLHLCYTSHSILIKAHAHLSLRLRIHIPCQCPIACN